MRTKGRIGRIVLCVALIFVGALAAARVAAQQPLGATVTGVDAKTGVVTAKVNSTGQVFEFTLANKALISRLHAGQGVYVNLGNKQVSLDGKSPSGTILTLSPLGRKLGVSASAPSGSGPPSGSGSSGTSANSGNANAPPVSPLCSQSGGTSTPLTQDNFSKAAAVATFCFTASCGASTTISGNTFPAGSSDWLAFNVPAPRANCAKPVIEMSISSSGGIVFDVLVSASGGYVSNSYSSSPSVAAGVPVIAGLGTVYNPLQPGMYYIRIYGGTAATVGTWTLKIAS